MNITHSLVTDLTIDLEPDEIAYVEIRGYLSSCLLGMKILTAGGSAVIQTSLDSTEFFQTATTHSDLTWENVWIGGVEYPAVTFDIPSVSFNSPNILYVKNTSAGTQHIKVSLRGNR